MNFFDTIDWLASEAHTVLVTLAIVGAAVAVLIVFLKSRAMAATLLAAIVGAIVIFFVSVGMPWLADVLETTLMR